MERVNIPGEREPFLAIGPDERAQIVRQLDEIIAWAPPVYVSAGCGGRLEAMRGAARLARMMLFEQGTDLSETLYTLGVPTRAAGGGLPSGGAWEGVRSFSGAFGRAFGLPGESPAFALIADRLRDEYAGGSLIRADAFEARRQLALGEYRQLTTQGCGRTLGLPLAILAAGVIGIIGVAVISGRIGPAKVKTRWLTRWRRAR